MILSGIVIAIMGEDPIEAYVQLFRGAFVGNFNLGSTLEKFVPLLLTGLAAAGGQFGVTAAYTYAPAREISVYDYTQIMFSAIMGLLVFGQLPDMLSFVGYCVIIAAGVIMFLYNKRRGGN